MMIERVSDAYFEALGEPKLGGPFGPIDNLRFRTALNLLAPGSVLDVGVYYGDFLKLARQRGHQIAGTEVNAARRDLANSLLGEDAVVVDFRNGSLGQFADQSFDNVVCMEVLEHIPDDRLGLSELCRVARKKVVVTVPFREKLRHILCLHCAKYTPHHGHLRSYDTGAFGELTPPGWKVATERGFARPLAQKFARRMPAVAMSAGLLGLLEMLPIGQGRWLLVVLEKDGP